MLPLGMHPADRATAGARMVVLAKRADNSAAPVLFLAVSLQKESAPVAKDVGLDDYNAV
jgi:hypothetical protein